MKGVTKGRKRPFKICPVAGCFKVMKRIDEHLLKFHKMDRSQEYISLCKIATVYNPETIVGIDIDKSPRKIFTCQKRKTTIPEKVCEDVAVSFPDSKTFEKQPLKNIFKSAANGPCTVTRNHQATQTRQFAEIYNNKNTSPDVGAFCTTQCTPIKLNEAEYSSTESNKDKS